MYLYVHEFSDPKDSNVREIKDLLLENSTKDYQAKIGVKQKSLKLETTKHGKPYYVKSKKVNFSISHSGKYWACLFDETNIGLDIEDYSSRNLPANRFMDIANRYYMSDEQDYVLGESNGKESEIDGDEALKNRFFMIWTAKEAYMKYTGNGFTEGFKNFSVLDGGLHLYFHNVPIGPQVVLTFCSKYDKNLDEMINI